MTASSPASQDDLHTLYANHYGWLVGWLRRHVTCQADAADVAQDTFLRLILRQRPQSLGAEPRALLTHIAKGLLIDHWRHQAVEQAYLQALATLPEPLAPSPETIAQVRESLLRIDAMLRSMPDRTRVIFLMAQIDGLKYADIASRLNMAEISVKRHMRRAYLACLALDA